MDYYTNKREANAHDILLCVKDGEKQTTPIGKGRGYRFGLPNQEYYFKSQDEMKKLFSDLPEAIINLKEIYEKVIGKEVSDADLELLSKNEKNKLISENAVLSTLHFQKRLEKTFSRRT